MTNDQMIFISVSFWGLILLMQGWIHSDKLSQIIEALKKLTEQETDDE